MENVRLRGSVVRFGVFEADLRSGELRKQGIKIKLHKQPFQILQILLEYPGEVISREALQERIWPSDTFVDFDHGLYNGIKKLREALGDIAETPRYIETLPKRGYRFIGEVKLDERVTQTGEAVNGASTTVPISLGQTRRGISTNFGINRGSIFGAAASLGLIFFLVIVFNADGIRDRLVGRHDPPVIHALAVLPLENLSDDPTQKYLSYGMTEELTTELAKISNIKVISHTSTARYENGKPSLSQIARELGVDGIVEGAVQHSGNQVRITIQLIYAPEDKHLWAESYDRDFRDVLALQSNVAAAIVAKIHAKTAGAKPIPVISTPPSSNLQALEAYLQGKYSLKRMGSGEGVQGYRSAIAFFKQAIADDPNFARAYVGLAQTYDAQFDWRPNEIMPLEEATIAKALELDPGSADAHLMNAGIKANYDCDLRAAEKEINEVVRLNPNLADAHDDLAGYLIIVAHSQEAIEEAHRAQELDPQGFHEARIFTLTGHYDRAIEQFRKELELNPNDGFSYIDTGGLVDAYAWKGMQRESVEALARAWTLFGFKAIGMGVNRTYKTSGYEGAYRYAAQQMKRLYAEGKVYKPDYIASWYARSGDKEQALKWLEITSRDNNHCLLAVYPSGDPDFVFMNSDPRFKELVKHAKLRQ